MDSVQENVETVLLVEDQVEADVKEVKVLEVEVNNKKCVKMKEAKDILDRNNLDVKPSDTTVVARTEEITNAPIYKKVDDSLKLCDEQIKENFKVKVGCDNGNGNVLKAVVNGEFKTWTLLRPMKIQPMIPTLP